MTDIRVPTLCESVTEATVGKWFKQPGDAVAVDEPLVELETDKVTLEVPAPAAGVLGEIAAKDGQTVGVGAILGSIKDGAAASKPAAAAAPAAAKPPEAPKAAPAPAAPAPKTADMPVPPAVRDVVSLKYSFDERIVDGLYCAKSLDVFRLFLEDPGRLAPRP